MEYGYSVAPPHGPVSDEHQQRPLYDDQYLEEEGEGYQEDDESMEVNPEVHGAPMKESAVSGGRDEPTELNTDELAASPDVVSSLQAMAISEQPEVQQRDQQCNKTPLVHEDESQMGPVSSDVEKKPSYTEKLSSTAAAAKDAAVSAASTVYAKIAGAVSGQAKEPTRQTPVETPKKPSYTERLSSAAAAAKDVAASTVYAKVAGQEEGTHDQAEQPKGGDAEKKGRYTEKLSSTATMREYLAENLRPGEEDRALCEVISKSMQKNREEEEEEEVNVEAVEKVRGAATSLVGRDGADSGASPPAAEAPRDERADQE